MSQQAKLANISSKYILQTIFGYIHDGKLKYRLFVHSKHFQNFLDLDIIDYGRKYISKFDMSLEDFLFSENESNPKSFNKNHLKDIFDEKIKKNNLDEKLIRKIIVDNIIKMGNAMEVKEYYDATYIIDIFSPLLLDIAKTKIFQTVFTLEIQWDIIQKFNLQNDYKEIFDNLKKSNVNYSLISFKCKQYDDIKNLTELNIDLKKLKSLAIIQKKINYEKSDDDSEKSEENEEDEEQKEEKQNLALFLLSSPESLFKNLFSMNELYNNLLYLNIDIQKTKKIIQSTCFDNLNNFKSLKFLSLNYLKFNDSYSFNLENLEIIILKHCSNFIFGQKMCNNLIEFKMEYVDLVEPEIPLNFPKLKEFIYKYGNMPDSKLMNFASLNKLEILDTYVSQFLLLGENILNEVHLKKDISYHTFIDEKEMLIKILSLDKLNMAEFYIKELDTEEISHISGENTNLKTLIIHWANEKKDCNLITLQKKFPNLSKIIIESPDDDYENEKPIKIEIKENKNCKITNFTLKGTLQNNIKFDCAPFSDLVKIKIKDTSNIYSNLKEILPLFNDSCKIKFLFLEKFKLQNRKNLKLDILKNIYNNLDNLPLIKDIHIECLSNEMDEEFHKKIVKKLLSLKLYRLSFIIKKYDFYDDDDFYEDEELEEIYPGIKLDKYKELKINKLG